MLGHNVTPLDSNREVNRTSSLMQFNFTGKTALVTGSDRNTGAIIANRLAQDGAIVQKLAATFGGIDYMTDRAREFIENWEVESYRQKQMEG